MALLLTPEDWAAARSATTMGVHITARPPMRLIRATFMDGHGAPLVGGMVHATEVGWDVHIPGEWEDRIAGSEVRLKLLWERNGEYREEEQRIDEIFMVSPREVEPEVPATPPNPGLTIEHFRRALEALSGLPPTDQGRPDHYPLRDEEHHVITDAEWQAQRDRIAAMTDAAQSMNP